MSLLGRAAKALGKMLAEELVKAAASNAGTKIGEAVGHRIGKKIDPTWNAEPPKDEDKPDGDKAKPEDPPKP